MPGLTVRSIAVGSLGGLAAAKRGECDLAPIHLFDDKSETYNTPFLSDGLELVPGWRRMQGIVFRKGDARFEGKTARRRRCDRRSPIPPASWSTATRARARAS